ncbi:MAG: UDP-diphosphatase, partial [Thermoproteota archaeon]
RGAVGLREGLALGAVQGLAAVPGVSRSGVTVAVLLAMGLDSTTALSLSFLCGIPASLGASLLSAESLPDPALVALTAAVGLCAMEALLRLASRVRPHRLALAFGAVGVGLALLSP